MSTGSADERIPRGQTLAQGLLQDGIFDNVVGHAPESVSWAKADVMERAGAMFGPGDREALLKYAGVKPAEPDHPAPKPKRSEIVASIADKLEKHYAGRLDRLAAIPRSAAFDELSWQAKERLLDAIAEVESRAALAKWEPPSEDEYAALHAELDEEDSTRSLSFDDGIGWPEERIPWINPHERAPEMIGWPDLTHDTGEENDGR